MALRSIEHSQLADRTSQYFQHLGESLGFKDLYPETKMQLSSSLGIRAPIGEIAKLLDVIR